MFRTSVIVCPFFQGPGMVTMSTCKEDTMTAYSPAVSCSAALLLLVGCATTTSATPTTSAGPSKAQITILYDAFGKDSAMKKDWGYAALVEYTERSESCSTAATTRRSSHRTQRQKTSTCRTWISLLCRTATRSHGRIGIPVEGEPQSEDLLAEGGVWRLWRRLAEYLLSQRTLLCLRNSATTEVHH